MSSEEWRILKVSDICTKVVSGGTPSTRNPDYYDGSIPWLKTQEVNFNRIYETETKITDAGFENSSAKWIPANSVIMAMYGATAGKIAINKVPITTNQACCNLIINDEIADYRYVYYNLMSRFQEIASMAVGGAQQNLNAQMIRDLKIPLPPHSVQCRIAEVLSTLDDKIELNRQTNATLEAIAQAIFKEWFVDFNYPGATGEMVESELGPIPKGWRVGKLNEILINQIGGDWGQENSFAEATKAISLRGTDIDSLKLSGSAPKAPIRWIKKSSLKKRRLANTDILIGGSGLGPIGKSIYCDEHLHEIFDFPITYSNFCKRLRAPSPAEAIFGEIFLENIYNSGDMKQYFTGTSIPNLDIKSLLDHKLVIPNKEILTEYYEQISKNKFHHLFNNESKLLSQLRDSLLPNLLNGENKLFT